MSNVEIVCEDEELYVTNQNLELGKSCNKRKISKLDIDHNIILKSFVYITYFKLTSTIRDKDE